MGYTTIMLTTTPLTRFPAAHKIDRQLKTTLIKTVVHSLETQPAAVERAIKVLFDRQTATEKAAEATINHNGLGVRANHGRRIAYYGKWLASGRHLTGRHLDYARKIAKTYAASQLFELAALKAGLIAA